jgi:cytochrome c oxidase subunit 1
MAVQPMSVAGIKPAPTPVSITAEDQRTVNRLTGISIGIAMVSLSIGVTIGVLQGLEHAGIDLYPYIRPFLYSYYQGLTLHGVLNALVWTTFFICGFLTYSTVYTLNRPLRYPWISWLGLGIMTVGLVTAAIPALLDYATVLYTFYPPLLAHSAFYIGLTLVVIGSWTVGYSLYFTYFAWRRENPGVRTPFVALASLITMVLWQICTLGVAAEILALILPWSFGLIPGTDPLLARSLFWFFGHPLVYFWLLPAYVSWYGMLPKQTNGKMFSEPLARLVFWLFLLFSTPVGFHHQYVDPGIPQGWKFLHGLFTFGVGFPSLLTAFTVVASLEIGGRIRGGKGFLGWIPKLNWGNPSYTAQNLAMILFIFGGIGGLINASFNLNLLVHNTTWIPGHFHLTVGSATTLSFMGIAYWLVPRLTGRNLLSRKLALAQAWTWFFGMILFSNGYHAIGLYYSAPRRSMLGSTPYFDDRWTPFILESTIGVTILALSATLFFVVMLGTLVSRKSKTLTEVPIAEPLDPTPAPKWLDTWWPWLTGAIALIIISYGPMLYQLVRDMQLYAPPENLRFW